MSVVKGNVAIPKTKVRLGRREEKTTCKAVEEGGIELTCGFMGSHSHVL